MKYSYFLFVLPIILLPVLMISGNLNFKRFNVFMVSLTASCVTFALTERICYASMMLMLSLSLMLTIQCITKLLKKNSYNSNINKVIVVHQNENGESFVSDCKSLYQIKSSVTPGSILSVTFECF